MTAEVGQHAELLALLRGRGLERGQGARAVREAPRLARDGGPGRRRQHAPRPRAQVTHG